ncbi:Gfo/Idh/MocA family oxidoreductase [Caulobacter sp. 1776]|uniref:Gfo/Idh/MocA family protein n=1 Tax=Caulobacter sp. 1776 TaxID=3156420 RepID=UPI0033989C93
MKRLRVGLLGPGGIGARHVAALKNAGDRFDFVAACGRDLTRTGQFVATHGGEAFTRFEAMLHQAQLDLLIVASPPSARDGEVEAAAAHGVHLLVEKPIALDLDIAAAMTRAVERAGVVAAVGFMYRFGDAVRRWGALQRAGGIGAPGLFSGSYHCNALHAPWWRERASSGGQMLEQVIHLIDLVRHTMGEPDTVYARAANLFHQATPGYDIEDVSALLFGWDDGRVASLNASNIAVPGRWQKEWRIVAERATSRFQDWNTATITHTAESPARDEVIAGATDPFVAQLIDLHDAITTSRAPMIPLAEGEASLRLALAARQSADERREIRLRS